jgi:D-alanine-D-alanine ligase
MVHPEASRGARPEAVQTMTTSGRTRIGIIFGGRSVEHEVSVASAKALVEALDPERYDIVPIGIDRDGTWYIGADPARMLASGGEVRAPAAAAAAGAAAALAARPSARFLADRFACTDNGHSRVDVMFPLIHGTNGEDGTLQGLLEMAGLPYVGSGVLGSAVGMDKWSQKLVLQGAGIPVVEFLAFRRADVAGREQDVHRRILDRLGLPVFVKPSNSGSSLGISKVKEPGGLGAALAAAFRYDRRLIVERGIDARELETALLGNDHPQASRVGEVVSKREWYDYEAKYTPGGMELIVPADIPADLESRIQELAVRAFGVMDAAGLARIDFFCDRRTGALYLNEVNTIPGFTAMSVYSKLWAASGLAYAPLVDRLVDLALERHRTDGVEVRPGPAR